MRKMPFNKKASDLCFNIKVLDIDGFHSDVINSEKSK